MIGSSETLMAQSSFLFRVDARDRHHSSRYAILRAMTEQEISMAGCTGSVRSNIFGQQASVEKLQAVRLHEIKKEFYRQLAVSGCARCKKEQRIFLAHRIRLLHLPEQLGSIGELALELSPNFFAHFITTAANAGSNRRQEASRAASKMPAHLTDPFFGNAFHRTPPPGMKNSDRTTSRVDQDERKAIGRLDGHEQSRRVGDNPVTGERLLRHTIDGVNQIGVDLANRDQWPAVPPTTYFFHPEFFRPECSHKDRPIAFDIRARILLSETKVQRAGTVQTRHPAVPRGKSVHQPRHAAQVFGAQEL